MTTQRTQPALAMTRTPPQASPTLPHIRPVAPTTADDILASHRHALRTAARELGLSLSPEHVDALIERTHRHLCQRHGWPRRARLPLPPQRIARSPNSGAQLTPTKSQKNPKKQPNHT